MDPVSEPTISDVVADAVSEPFVVGSVGDSKMLEGSIDARPVEPPSLPLEVCMVRELPSVAAAEPSSLRVSEAPPLLPSEDLAWVAPRVIVGPRELRHEVYDRLPFAWLVQEPVAVDAAVPSEVQLVMRHAHCMRCVN